MTMGVHRVLALTTVLYAVVCTHVVRHYCAGNGTEGWTWSEAKKLCQKEKGGQLSYWKESKDLSSARPCGDVKIWIEAVNKLEGLLRVPATLHDRRTRCLILEPGVKQGTALCESKLTQFLCTVDDSNTCGPGWTTCKETKKHVFSPSPLDDEDDDSDDDSDDDDDDDDNKDEGYVYCVWKESSAVGEMQSGQMAEGAGTDKPSQTWVQKQAVLLSMVSLFLILLLILVAVIGVILSKRRRRGTPVNISEYKHMDGRNDMEPESPDSPGSPPTYDEITSVDRSPLVGAKRTKSKGRHHTQKGEPDLAEERGTTLVDNDLYQRGKATTIQHQSDDDEGEDNEELVLVDNALYAPGMAGGGVEERRGEVTLVENDLYHTSGGGDAIEDDQHIPEMQDNLLYHRLNP